MPSPVDTPMVVSSPAAVPFVIDERTTAMKSGPGRMSAGMKTAKTLMRMTVGDIGISRQGRLGTMRLASQGSRAGTATASTGSSRICAVTERNACLLEKNSAYSRAPQPRYALGMEEPRHSFGPFVFDTRRRALDRDGEPVAIGTRAIAVLEALLGASGEAVSKARLVDLVWP